MTPYDLIGYAMAQTSTITSIVSTRIYHGDRPKGKTVPCINFFELNTTRYMGMETSIYSINCRANNSGQARDLAREVINLFDGSSSNGVYGEFNGFSVARGSLQNDAGLVTEPTDNIYNAPIDIAIVYASATVT